MGQTCGKNNLISSPVKLSKATTTASTNGTTTSLASPTTPHTTNAQENELKIFDTVNTVYGPGYISAVRENDFVVLLTNWQLAQGQSPTLYLQKESISRIPGAFPGTTVSTVYGEARVESIRADNVHVTRPLHWKLANDTVATLYLQPEALSLTQTAGLEAGDEVMTVYGRGFVEQKRAAEGDVVVKLRHWALAQGQSPTLYLQASACTKIHGLREGSVAKTVYGLVRVKEILRDGQHVCEALHWKLADGKAPTLYLAPEAFALLSLKPTGAMAASAAAPKVKTSSSAGQGGNAFKIFDTVNTVYGPGYITAVRSSDFEVRLSNWQLAQGQSPTLYLQKEAIRFIPGAFPGTTVSTVYGEARVESIRADNVHVTRPLHWKLANDTVATLYLQPEALSLTQTAGLEAGDEVMTVYGRGFVEQKRAAEGDLVVKLRHWALAQGQSPTLYLQASACTKIHGLREGSVAKTVYGLVRVKEILRDGQHVCEALHWKLADGKAPTLYLAPEAFALLSLKP